jgi:hypothetical protein
VGVERWSRNRRWSGRTAGGLELAAGPVGLELIIVR